MKRRILSIMLILVLLLAFSGCNMFTEKTSITEYFDIKKADVVDILFYDYVVSDYNDIRYEYSLKETSTASVIDPNSSSKINTFFECFSKTKFDASMLSEKKSIEVGSFHFKEEYIRVAIIKTNKGDFRVIFGENYVFFPVEFDADSKSTHQYKVLSYALAPHDKNRHRNPPQMATPAP